MLVLDVSLVNGVDITGQCLGTENDISQPLYFHYLCCQANKNVAFGTDLCI